LTEIITLVPAVDNGWAFAAFVVGMAVYIYLNKRGAS
jgi:hypothetical protein